MPAIDAILHHGREKGGSDIHFTVGVPPLIRLDGDLTPIEGEALERDQTIALVTEILDDFHQGELNRKGSVDLSYRTGDGFRYRINICHQRLGLSAVCRVIPDKVPSLEELGMPTVLSEFCHLKSGLVLVTGGTGTGKSTTLAAMIHEINNTRNVNIITLEDPIEFSHECNKSLVVQRELGSQVTTFKDGLRSALREDPDVILVGEMRDYETIAAAVEAAETGHLVLGTLHTRGAFQTIHRLIDVFPSETQAQIRHTLSENLRAVVSQVLVKTADGRGRRAAVETMVMTPGIAQLIREQKSHQIPSAISTGKRLGMQLMDQSLLSLLQVGEIDPDEAFLAATDKKEFIPFVQNTQLLATLDGPAPTGRPMES